ncbi:MAG: response regulator, partial [Atribacterota bacterium]|nr:response regulator [Atribacterota bacterium]
MKTLIVDDIEDNLYLLETLLKGSGYEVVTAKDGLEALTKLKEESVDLIISDILMPRMDGFQFCRECKKDERLKRIPFIFYTATYIDKKDEEFALSLGADRFIVKPAEPEALLKILNEVIEEYKKGAFIVPKEPVKEEEEIYFERYNKRLVHKLEKKMFDLEKANKILQEKEEKIYRLNQFQENIIHNANVWINVLGEKANVVLWNEAAEKMSGYSAAEVIGHDKIWRWLYPDEKYRKEITTKVNAIIRKGEVAEDFETRVCCKDGKVKIISWYSRNLTNPQGKIIGSVALGRDVTERKQAEERIKHLNLVLHTIRNINQLIFKEKDQDILMKGACNSLIKTRGYCNSWIVLLDGKGMIEAYAEAGLGEDFLS